jgi:hypothetical protein
MSSFKRTLALTVSGFLAGAAISISVASPAQASGAQCINYLDNWYYVSNAVATACTHGDALGGQKGLDYCKGSLKTLGGFTSEHINGACSRAIS